MSLSSLSRLGYVSIITFSMFHYFNWYEIHLVNSLYCQQYTTLHTTTGLHLKLSRVGPGQSLDERPDAAGNCVHSGPKNDTPGQ